MKFKDYIQDDYKWSDFIWKKARGLQKNSSGVAAPIEMYDDPLDPSKVKHKTKKILYGTSMGLYRPNRNPWAK